MNKFKCFHVFILSLILLSCKNDDIAITSVDEEIQAWLDTMGLTATRDDNTGIYYYAEVTNSSGVQATNGRVAAIYYQLYDLNDNVIASHQRTNGDSLIFKIGASAVYPLGIDFGVSQMRSGDTYHFILPPSQGYESLTSNAINGNLITRIEIELVALHNEADIYVSEELAIQQYIDDNLLDSLALNPLDSVFFFPSGVAYKRRRAGTGVIPEAGDTIIVDYQGRFINDASFGSSSGFTWSYASGQPRELLPGFEEGVSRMQTNERALIMVPSSNGYQESALVIPESITSDLIEDSIIPEYVAIIPPYVTLLFEITRVD